MTSYEGGLPGTYNLQYRNFTQNPEIAAEDLHWSTKKFVVRANAYFVQLATSMNDTEDIILKNLEVAGKFVKSPAYGLRDHQSISQVGPWFTQANQPNKACGHPRLSFRDCTEF